MVAPTSSSLNSLISDDKIAQFRRDGFCVVDNLFTSEEVDAIEAFFEDYKENGEAVYDNGMRFEEQDKTKQQIRAMHPHRYSKRALEWALNQRVTGVLTVLLEKDPLLAQTMYYFKPPGSKGQGMHQDNFYLLTAPATCIAAWTAIDAATIDNGCLYMVPGSHEHDIHCPSGEDSGGWMSYGDSHIKPFPRDAKPVPVEVPRGSTAFFGGQMIHGSGPNRTKDRSRRTFIGHYVDDTTRQISQFYHPVLNLQGEVVSRITTPSADTGGPCGDGWLGATH
jgi:ectoine hydroxylase-related dioxygenase (phytanoyl-CoA dioxygenase family)